MTDLEALLAERRLNRADDNLYSAILDRLQDDDGPPVFATVGAVIGMWCEGCGIPDSPKPLCRDRFGTWHVWDDVHAMNSSDGYYAFGDEFPDPVEAALCFYRTDRWRLVCGTCRAKLEGAASSYPG